MKIIKNILFFNKIITSNGGVYYGWEILYKEKIIAELVYSDSRCGRQDLYEVVVLDKELASLEIKEILEFTGTYRNKFLRTEILRPEVDFLAHYYDKFNKVGAEYLRIYEHNCVAYNKFYKFIIDVIYFYRVFFPEKRGKKLVINENCSEMIPWWIEKYINKDS